MREVVRRHDEEERQPGQPRREQEVRDEPPVPVEPAHGTLGADHRLELLDLYSVLSARLGVEDLHLRERRRRPGRSAGSSASDASIALISSFAPSTGQM